MKKQLILLFLLSSLQSLCFGAGSYSPYQIQIDPNTHRAFTNQNQPIWDGTYPQPDGSTIWVNNGIATVNRYQKSYQPKPQYSTRPTVQNTCLTLVSQSCGNQNQCNQSKTCKLANQMAKLENAEHYFSRDQVARYGKIMIDKCQQALSNTTIFPRCNNATQSNYDSCQQLINRSCGGQNQCTKNTACQLSKQLQQRQQKEQKQNLSPNTPTVADNECNLALNDHRMFPACY